MLNSERLTLVVGVGADGVLLQHRVRHGVEGVTVSVTGLVTPLMVRLPSIATGLSPSNFTAVDLKLMLGNFSVWKIVFGLDVLVEQRVAGIHRLGVDRHVDRAGLCGAVEHDLAAGLVEALLLVRVAEMAVLEARIGVGGLDG
jgi:hypothetical protein